jgi:hypothetical protein
VGVLNPEEKGETMRPDTEGRWGLGGFGGKKVDPFELRLRFGSEARLDSGDQTTKYFRAAKTLTLRMALHDAVA